jgi:hypothetical protein
MILALLGGRAIGGRVRQLGVHEKFGPRDIWGTHEKFGGV